MLNRPRGSWLKVVCISHHHGCAFKRVPLSVSPFELTYVNSPLWGLSILVLELIHNVSVFSLVVAKAWNTCNVIQHVRAAWTRVPFDHGWRPVLRVRFLPSLALGEYG
jgi:hypothetical protein